jgi:hypothetical protein
MQLVMKSALVAAACCLGLAMSTPSQAQQQHDPYAAQHYSLYQNPDGSYDSLTDLTRDIWGIPCGVECTREAQARWSHYAYTHPYGEYRRAYGQ